ncbi:MULTISPECIES: PleD family two-component system response regulator [unclassified Shewanella]|uniref:response regulator n=1 Tax=unclassified Shewanella TaxID=196818 RepID=UPI000C83D103|nr:response regulator [Shewanella sp. 10N.286.51.B7]PMG77345.1 histidine kinase [Shewanella sp. 10N.286.51.B7]
MDKSKILVIDDDPVCTSMLLAILGDDYLVMTANSGDGAIELLSSVEPDLIFLDITMPDVNGYQVIKYVKKHSLNQQVPIVVVSSLIEESDQDFALKLGADDYLTKPILPNNVQKMVDKYL